MKKFQNAKGITIIALVITVIVLLILAGISLSGIISKEGLFAKTKNASSKYNEAKAREALETVLLGTAQYEKRENLDYDEEEFLDELIKKEIPGSNVKGNVAMIGGEHAFELDRSVPKIGTGGNNGYLGNPKDLTWPDVDATAQLSDDKKTSTITIKAKEEKNGINKIEIWLLGEKIKEYPYENVKTEITLPYTATQNGKYTIKAYGEIMENKTVEVTGIVASVKFSLNGSEEWKKEHSTTVTIQETADKVVNAKYEWTNSVTTPNDNQFPDNQTFKSGDTITGGNNTMTGTYYLWIMLKTQSGEIFKWRSEGFNFDNEGPQIVNFTAEKYSINGITFNAGVQDTKSGLAKVEFYVDNNIKDKEEYNSAIKGNKTKSKNIEGISTGNHRCMVVVYDSCGNSSSQVKSANTMQYAWNTWACKSNPKPELYYEEVNLPCYPDYTIGYWTTATAVMYTTESGHTYSRLRLTGGSTLTRPQYNQLVGKYVWGQSLLTNNETIESCSPIYLITSISKNRRYVYIFWQESDGPIESKLDKGCLRGCNLYKYKRGT